MDIETLRRANEALSLMEETQKLLDHERKEIDKGTRRVEILEARIAGCKQTLMECGVAVPVSRMIRCEPPRTLESEGQKWDEAARLRQATVDVPRSMGMSARLPSWIDAYRSPPENYTEHHGC